MSIQSSGKKRIVIIVLVTVVLVGYIIFQRVSNPGSSAFRNNIILPWGLIAVVISFYFFGETNRVRNAKRDERREHINERRQEILNNLRKKKEKDMANLKDKLSDNNPVQ